MPAVRTTRKPLWPRMTENQWRDFADRLRVVRRELDILHDLALKELGPSHPASPSARPRHPRSPVLFRAVNTAQDRADAVAKHAKPVATERMPNWDWEQEFTDPRIARAAAKLAALEREINNVRAGHR